MSSLDLDDPAVLEQLVALHLERRDWRGVEAAMTLLALRDPHRAALLFEAMHVGLAIAKEARPDG